MPRRARLIRLDMLADSTTAKPRGTSRRNAAIPSDAIDITDRIRSFDWRDSMLDGGWAFTLKVEDSEWEFWNDILAGSEGKGIQFRLRVQRDAEEEVMPWRQFYIDVTNSVWRNNSQKGEIVGGDERVLLQQEGRFRAYLKMRISDIVTEIAARHGLVADIGTLDDVPVDRWQTGIDDWTFLRHVLLPQATVASRGDVYAWLTEGILHFKTIDFGRDPIRDYNINVGDDRLQELRVAFGGRRVDRAGGATLKGVGFDHLTKQGHVFIVDAAAASTLPALAKKVPTIQEDATRYLAVARPEEPFTEAEARHAWSSAAPQYYLVTLPLGADIGITVDKMIKTDIRSQIGQQNFISGKYPVLEVQHRSTSSGFTTSVVVARREAFIGQDDPTGSNAGKGKVKDTYLDERRSGQPVSQTKIVKNVQELPQ